MNQQLKMFWVAPDYSMVDDMGDFRVKATKAERIMIINGQKAINHYEVKLDGEFWNGRFKEMFPRYEFQALGSTNGMMEGSVHSKFYIQMADAIGLNDENFHNAVFDDKELNERIKFIGQSVKGDCDLRCLAAMCFIEGTALFSVLASLMSFRKPNSLNLMKNMASGIVHSCQDELIHCLATAMCFKQLLEESNLSKLDLANLQRDIIKMSEDVVAHEYLLIEKLFEGGELRNITKEELRRFVEHRKVECLNLLGYDTKDSEEPNPVADWLYPMVKSYNFGDFFQTTNKDYVKSVNKELFKW